MDVNTIDRVSKRLGSNASRRQLFGGLIGSAAVALAAVALGGGNVEAKKGKGRGKGKGVNKPVGKGNGLGQGGGNTGGGNTGGNGKGNGPAKFSFCHKQQNALTGADEYEFVANVPAPQAKEHRKHADDVECVKDPCKVYNGTCNVSADGTTVSCGFDPATSSDGSPVECGNAGTCDPTTGTCVEPTV